MYDVLFNRHFVFSEFMDSYHLGAVHFVACFLGVIMALYVMQLWTRGAVVFENDCWFARHARRFSLLILALSMLWSLAYATTKGWEPWPPYLGMLVAIDIFLATNIILAGKRRRLLG